MNDTERDLYRRWYVGLCTAHIAHQRAALRSQRRHIRLGIPVIVLTTVVGTTAFASLQTASNSRWLHFSLGLISVTAAVLASLQTFLNLGELAEKHKAAAGRYGSLRRRFELEFSRQAETLTATMNEIRAEWDELDASTPNVADDLYQAALEPARRGADSLFPPSD